MRARTPLLLFASLLLLSCGTLETEGPVQREEVFPLAASASAPSSVEGEVIVRLRGDKVRAASLSAGELLPGAREIGRLSFEPRPRTVSPGKAAPSALAQTQESSFTLTRLRLPPGLSVPQAMEKLGENPLVEYVEPNYRVRRAATVPNDPFFVQQWGLANSGQTLTGDRGTITGTAGADIDAPVAWDGGGADGSVVVAVVDSGIDLAHPDLAANIWSNPGETGTDGLGRNKRTNGVDDDGNGYVDDIHGWNFAGSNSNPGDDDVDGHGTHVAGVIGAVGNNGTGVAGINWKVQLMALKFLDSTGSGTLFDAVEAFNYAVRNGARVVNASYTYPQNCSVVAPSNAERDAISAARDAGVLVVAAAGNFGCDNEATPFYPASHPLENILSVAATDPNDAKASWSNYGSSTVDLGAPGVNIYSTVRTALLGRDGRFGYNYQSGTSQASPFVAGAAALLLSSHPELTYTEVRDALLSTVDPVPSLSGRSVSGGRLNLFRALGASLLDAPEAPADLTMVQAAPNRIEISWSDRSGNETSFVVERRSGGGSFVQVGQTNSNVSLFADENPPDGLEVVYRVKAMAGFRSSAYSNEVSALIPLRAPDGVAAGSSAEGIILSWRDLSVAEDSYVIERRSESEAGFTVLATLPANTATYLDTSALQGVTYLYRILARNALAGNSPYSAETTARISAPGDSGGGGSSCFIATAAWGTPFAPEIDVLRHFRDKILLTSGGGRILVDAYYFWSPPVAHFIAGHDTLRTVVRWMLKPVVWMAGMVVTSADAMEPRRPPPEPMAEEVLVRFRPGIGAAHAQKVLEERGFRGMDHLTVGDRAVFRLRVPPGTTVPETIKKLETIPEVESAEPNLRVRSR